MQSPNEADAANKPQVNGEDSSAGALESAERHIAGSPGASTSCDGSGSAFGSTFSALLDWAQEKELIRSQADYDFFQRPTDGHGEEHEAWFDPASERWFKVTKLNRFGLAWGRDGSATVHEYLLRLLLKNRYFGDDIHLVALINCEGKMRLLTSQPHIVGDFATPKEIRKWFEVRGFQRIEIRERIAWYLTSENLLVADAHERNVLRTAVGTLVPIDLNVIQPSGELLKGLQLIFTQPAQLTFDLKLGLISN